MNLSCAQTLSDADSLPSRALATWCAFASLVQAEHMRLILAFADAGTADTGGPCSPIDIAK